MEGGQDGTHGAYAQWDVGAELKYVHDPALIPHPPLVEQIASEIDDRSNHAMSNRAKVNFISILPEWMMSITLFRNEQLLLKTRTSLMVWVAYEYFLSPLVVRPTTKSSLAKV